jgi:hypothetical protein
LQCEETGYEAGFCVSIMLLICVLLHCSVCNWSCSVATDTLGLYCSVNTQGMKLDRVSVFCYISMFCNYNSSVALGVLNLYCSVNSRI